jgi:hypothetical protein
MPATSTQRFEKSLRHAVSADHLRGHLDVFSRLVRHSGSEGERQAAEYIVQTLRDYGLAAELHEFDALISTPLTGSLEVLDAAGQVVFAPRARTRSFSAATPTGGITAELVHVPSAAQQQGEMIFSHRETGADYAGIDVAGKVVIAADGGPDGVRRAQQRGAVAHIHGWPSDEDVVHEMIASSVWGTPTPDSARRLPTIPVLGLNHRDGERIEGMLEAGPLRVRISTAVETGWTRLPLVTTTIPGAASPDFLLVGAHIDSWYEGVTDNATGDAALLEMARVLSEQVGGLRHGVRFAWWPGHSTGRYAGSTWYADTHFRELRDHGLGYLNIDSPGVRDTQLWDCRYTTGEVEHVTVAAVRELSGQEPNVRRPLRAADQSFLGIGLPSLGAYRMLPPDHPDRKTVGGCGGAYWWHSPEDTLDKADAAILAEDTQVYLALVARMCAAKRIPYHFAATARDFVEALTTLQSRAGQHLDLTSTIRAAEEFHVAAERLSDARCVEAPWLHEGLKRIARLVNPALFTIDGPFEMDPALQLPLLPGLAPMEALAALEPAGNDYRFLRTAQRRQKNRIEDALVEATALAGQLATQCEIASTHGTRSARRRAISALSRV